MPPAPHFALDPRTLHLAILIFGMVSGGALWLTWRRHPSIAGISDWAYGIFLVALGGMGIGLRGIIWDLLSIVIANTVMIAGHAIVWRGVMRFRKLPVRPGHILILPFLTLLFQLGALLLAPQWITGRIAFISAMIGLLEALTCHALLRPAPVPASAINRLLAFLMLAAMLNYLGRIGATLSEPPPTDYLGSSDTQGWFLLLALSIGLAKIFGFLTLVGDRLQEELNRAASHDFLTQLPNRRAFWEQAQHEISRLARGAPAATLLLIDLDHFKVLNDTYGHNAGDAALRAFGLRLASCLRQHDLGCRYGGEEFCVLLPQTGVAEARRVAERIRAEAEAAAGPGIGTTVSIGVAPLLAGQRLENAINQADRALYLAKDGGRNRIAAADSDVAAPSVSILTLSASSS